MKNIFLLLLILNFFGCATVSNAISDSANYDKEFLTATYYFNSQEYDKAAKIYENILKNNKDSYVAVKLTETYLAKKDTEKAKNLLESFLKDKRFKGDPELNFYMGKLYIEYLNELNEGRKYIEVATEYSDKLEYLEYLARVLEAGEDYSAAINIYTKLINKTNDSEYYYKRGFLYIKLGIVKDGVNDLIKADEIVPNLRARLMLSDVYINQKEYEKAAEYLEKAISLNSNFPSIKIKLAEVYKQLGDNKKYISLLESLVDDYSGKERVYVLRQIAASFYEIKDYDNALKYFKLILQDSPEDTQALFYTGIAYEAKGETDKAIEYYEKAYNVRNDYSEPLKRIAYLLFVKKEYDKAVNYLDKVEDTGKDIEFFRLKAAIYENNGDIEKAIAIVNEGLNKNPESEELLFTYAILKEKKKDYDEVVKTLKKLIEINPKSPTYLNFLGYLYADMGINLDEAYDLIKSALKYEPNNAAYLDSMAWVLYKMKKYEEAYDYQRRALKISPEEKEMREHMQSIMKALNINKSIEDVIKE
ncbi:MAG: Tetratricopeptide 2 repeat-containing protein [Deferribacteraceae bacterium]|nr:Tetratricopeptide 2 repeat-containing protein [Deferribacteraceae bacterium]